MKKKTGEQSVVKLAKFATGAKIGTQPAATGERGNLCSSVETTCKHKKKNELNSFKLVVHKFCASNDSSAPLEFNEFYMHKYIPPKL